MNTYTVLTVVDQMTAVEALPPVPTAASEQSVTLSTRRSAG